ncbi:MAG: alpha/beta fold hydrolase [Candidatus Limnocylindrales bacterium]
MSDGSAPDDDRPTIVFLHGTVLTGAAWGAQIAGLQDAFHCLAPDLPGHGTASAERFTLDHAAAGVAALIERQARDGRAILVGLSLGGYVAMEVAARWPERVRGLVLSGASADPVGLQGLGFRAFAAILGLVPEPLLDGVYRSVFRFRFPAAIAAPILAAGFTFRSTVPALEALIGRRFRPRLAAYPGPSLLVNGEFDLFFRSTERAFAVAAVHPRRVLIRRATHLANLDQPARFTAAIRAFASLAVES